MKLTVTEVVRSRALAEVLVGFHIRAGGRVFFGDLARAWRSETGLRHSDLQRSLAELGGRGGLRFHDSEHGRLVEVTVVGARELDAPMMTLGDLFRRMHAAWVLSRTRGRFRHEAATETATPTLRRRAADRALNA